MMFCRKKCSPVDTFLKMAGGMLALVGIVAIAGVCITRSKSAKKHLKNLACTCGDAAMDAVDTVSDKITDTVDHMKKSK